ncbi:MAG TPA: methyltransferase domain-containing protein [Devosiaceae bacterium]|nr:methyltransferase domain-containing protein [Devosiaceae bacterium]
MPSESDRIIGLYQRHARAWARERGDRLFETAWLDRFRGLLPEDATVLDIGCGSGKPLARALTERGCKITGIDASPEMIAMCRADFPYADWHVADMRELALPRSFDGILAWDSFFHLSFDDQRKMFPIFRVHAAERAAVMFTSGPSHGEAMGEFHGEPLYHASLDPAEYRALLAENGFGVVACIVEDPECGGHTIWLAQRV